MSTKTKFSYFFLISLLFLFSITCLSGQSIPLNTPYVKPTVKFSMASMFYENITEEDLNRENAWISGGFLEVKSEFVDLEDQVITLNGLRTFTNRPENLPLLQNINVQSNGQLFFLDLSYYSDNFGNIYTQQEMDYSVNNPVSTYSTGCINLNYQFNFDEDFRESIERACEYFAGIICCEGSFPVTININQTTMGTACASPLYPLETNPGDNCNHIPIHPFMSTLLGEDFGPVADVFFNPNRPWFTGAGDVPDNLLDLESVALHEFIHTMGNGSRINMDGSSFGGAYSPWDLFLEITPEPTLSDPIPISEPLLIQVPTTDNQDCCFTLAPNPNFNFHSDPELNDIVEAASEGRITIAGIPVCLSNPIAIIDTDPLFMNMLSHIDEDCLEAVVCDNENTWSSYVFNSIFCFGDERRTLHPDEISMLSTLGFCTNIGDEESCYLSLNDDLFHFFDGNVLSFDLNTVLSNDVLPENFSPETDLSIVGTASSNIEINENEIIIFSNLSPGPNMIDYQITSCDGLFCDIGRIEFFIAPEGLEECDSEACNIACFGDFEDFFPSADGFFNYLNLETYNFEDIQNTPDVLLPYEDNTNIIRTGYQRNLDGIQFLEFFHLEFSEPISDGCTIEVLYNADCGATNFFGFLNPDIETVLFASNKLPCPSSELPTFDSEIENFCTSGENYYNMNFENDFDLNILCSEQEDQGIPINVYGDFEQEFLLEWTNNTGEEINYITIIPSTLEFGRNELGFDNFIITSDCNREVQVTPPTDRNICTNDLVSLDYNICFTGTAGGPTTVTLEPTFENAPDDWGSVVSPTFPLVIELGVGQCTTLVLNLQVSEDLGIGQIIPIDMNFANSDACNPVDQETTELTFTNESSISNEFIYVVNCAENPAVVAFVPSQPSAAGTTFFWDFGDGFTSTETSPMHPYQSNGTYTVSLTVENECGMVSSTQIIEIACEDPTLNCECPVGGITLVDDNIQSYQLDELINEGILPGNGLVGGCLVLDGTLNVNESYNFANTQVIFNPGSSIIVEENAALVGFQTTFMGCDELWQGIIVENGGTVSLLRSRIYDAVHGLELLDGSSIAVNSTMFSRNHIGILVPPNATNNINMVTPFFNNTFDGTSELLENDLTPSDFPFAGLVLNNTQFVFGAPDGFDSQNEFNSLYNGIIAEGSFLSIAGVNFRNMRSSSEGFLQNHGIYFTNSFIGVFDNEFSNLGFGMRGNQSSLFSLENNFNEFNVGIEMVHCANEFIRVKEETFTNYTERGIAIFNSPNPSSIILEDNTFTNTAFMENHPEGISVFNSGSQNFGASIKDNLFTLAEGNFGITINNADRSVIRDNTINFLDVAGQEAVWSRGINVVASDAGTISENTITAPAGFPASGFQFENSGESSICCNTVTGTQNGFQFMGLGCDNTDFKTNTMEGNANGLLLGELTIIGEQGTEDEEDHNGNLWCDGSVAFIGSEFLTAASRFIVDGDDNMENCLVLPESNSSTWFNVLSGNTLNCEISNICDIGNFNGNPNIESEIKESDLLGARQNFEGNFSETSNWILGTKVLKKVSLNPDDMLGNNQVVDQFYTNFQNSVMDRYLFINDEINAAYNINDTQNRFLRELQESFLSDQQEISEIDKQVMQTNNSELSTELIEQRKVLTNNLSENYQEYLHTISSIKSNRTLEVEELVYQNESLANTNIANSNEQSINDLMLGMEVVNVTNISNNDKELLVSIAFQCAKSGGIAVYKARGLYDLLNPGNQNNWKEVDENCDLENEKANLNDNNSFSSINKLRIMPNPSNGKIFIEFPILDSKKSIMVYDVLGKVVYKKELKNDEKQLSVDLSNTKGIFFVHLQTEGGIVKTEKIIIQ